MGLYSNVTKPNIYGLLKFLYFVNGNNKHRSLDKFLTDTKNKLTEIKKTNDTNLVVKLVEYTYDQLTKNYDEDLYTLYLDEIESGDSSFQNYELLIKDFDNISFDIVSEIIGVGLIDIFKEDELVYLDIDSLNYFYPLVILLANASIKNINLKLYLEKNKWNSNASLNFLIYQALEYTSGSHNYLSNLNKAEGLNTKLFKTRSCKFKEKLVSLLEFSGDDKLKLEELIKSKFESCVTELYLFIPSDHLITKNFLANEDYCVKTIMFKHFSITKIVKSFNIYSIYDAYTESDLDLLNFTENRKYLKNVNRAKLSDLYDISFVSKKESFKVYSANNSDTKYYLEVDDIRVEAIDLTNIEKFADNLFYGKNYIPKYFARPVQDAKDYLNTIEDGNKSKIIKNGDILITREKKDYHIYIVSNLASRRIVVNIDPNIVVIRSNDNQLADTRFLYSYLKNGKGKEDFNNIVNTKNNIARINNKDLKNFSLNLPSRIEQLKLIRSQFSLQNALRNYYISKPTVRNKEVKYNKDEWSLEARNLAIKLNNLISIAIKENELVKLSDDNQLYLDSIKRINAKTYSVDYDYIDLIVKIDHVISPLKDNSNSIDCEKLASLIIKYKKFGKMMPCLSDVIIVQSHLWFKKYDKVISELID